MRFVLVVRNPETPAESLARPREEAPALEVRHATNPQELQEALAAGPDLILFDGGVRWIEPSTLVEVSRRSAPRSPVLLRNLEPAAPPGPDEPASASLPEDAFGVLFERNPQPMWIFDRETLAFLAINQAACDRLGAPREELLRLSAADVLQPEDLPVLTALLPWWTAWAKGRVLAGLWRCRRARGGPLELEVSWSPVTLGGRQAVLAVAWDVTPLLATQRKLAASERQLREAQAVGHVGSWQWHVVSGAVTWSEELFRVFGVHAAPRT